MKLENLIAPWLERVINAYLMLDPETAKQLRPISGKLIALEFTELNLAVLIRPVEAKVQISANLGFEPDVIIRGSPLGLARLTRSKNITGGSLGEDVKIRGDAEVGRIFREVLASVEIDWEGLLAARVGDIPAHQAGRAIRGLAAGLTSAMDKLRMDLSEYLQEEARVVPTRVEVEQFMSGVDLLRGEIDRLEARIERLAAAFSELGPTHSGAD
ncbi:MAG TPA: SCP2 sterol-binding domain-containing protein [Gammaproteobacteria bacterium]|jgi:ubiquinone biosynthesis protein UbiJ|nr:SCP2 sterol-binding domain-containing protein [Gammaproteobacteria bacterium]